MTDKFIFSDESGCFTFNRAPNVSKYFVVTTIALDKCDIGSELQDLRRSMVRRGLPVGDCFHATTDTQRVRDEVFDLIRRHSFRVDATILEKSKAQPQTRTDEPRFFQYAWFFHFKKVGPVLFDPTASMMVTAAALGTNKKKIAFKTAVNNVVQQVLPREKWVVDFPQSASEPCLQIADYCCWAIARKWERGCARSHALIADKIATEFDLWRTGTTHFY